jgi:Ca2+-binding EF-hand superfamily protein
MQIRLADLFRDFDPMRSGLMTESRFIRCVSASLERGHGNQLTSDEIEVLLKEYRLNNSKMVRWKDFVAKIDKLFEAATTEDGTPNSEEFGTILLPFRRPLSPKSEEELTEIIKRLKLYRKCHGADPKSWFHDFDKNSKGWVNYNQFRRGMPQNLISREEEDLLIAKYGDPNSETVNYFKLHTDVMRKGTNLCKYRQESHYQG